MGMPDIHSTPLIPYAPRQIGSDTIETVNARELHQFLGPETRYDIWITRRIETFDFVLNRDFTTFKIEQGPVSTTEYFVTLDMAKHLAMIERTPKGKEAREYFIAVEKAHTRQLKAPRQPKGITEAQKRLEDAKIAVIDARMAVLQARRDIAEERLKARPATETKADIPLQLPVPQPQLSVIQYLLKHERHHHTLADENMLGRLAAVRSRELGQTIGHTADRRWKNADGTWKTINVYNEDVLDEMYAEQFGKDIAL